MTGFSSGLNTQAPLLGSLRTYLQSALYLYFMYQGTEVPRYHTIREP